MALKKRKKPAKKAKKPNKTGRKSKVQPAKSTAPVADDAAAEAVFVSTSGAAALVGVGAERIRQLAKEGWITKAGRDCFRLVDVVNGYFRFLKDEERRSSKSASQSRMQDARAREIELRTARRENLLIETTEAIGVVDEILGGLKSEIAGLPARVTRDVELRHKIGVEIDDVFRRAADRFEQKATDLRTRGEAVTPVAEDDA